MRFECNYSISYWALPFNLIILPGEFIEVSFLCFSIFWTNNPRGSHEH